MAHGWSLETTTIMRERGGCRDWFMKHAVDICLTPETLEDIAIGAQTLISDMS